MAVVAAMTAAQMFTAAMAVTSIALSVANMIHGRPSFQMSDTGANVNRKGTDNPNIVTFGNVVIPAVQVWNKVSANDSKFLYEVHSLGHGPLRSIKNVFIDEQPLFGNSGNDISEQWMKATESGFNNVHVGTRRGNLSNATWPELINNSGGEWTAKHRGNGMANLSFKVERPAPSSGDVSDRVLSDKFGATALVEGIPVIDPRVDTLLLGWSDVSKRSWVNGNVMSYRNPACALLTYLADPEFGFRLEPDMIDLPSFIALANWCDQNKITIDGYIDQNNTFGEIINNFSTSWGGSVYLVGGKISVAAETQAPVRFNITEDALVDTVSLTNNKTDYFNTIKIDFQNKDTNFAKDSFVLPKDSLTDETIREDGRIIEKTLDCPLSTDPDYIKRIANRELKRSKLCRKELTISISNRDYPLEMGDVFTVTESMYNLDKTTKWRVIKLDNTLDEKTLVTKVSAQEYDARIYDTTQYDDGNLSALKPLPDYTVLPVTSLKFTQNTGHSVGSGTLSWTTNYYSDSRYVVQYRLTGATDWQTYGQYPSTSVIMTNLQTGRNYDFRVRVIASVGGSAWTTITNQRVNKSISLPKVTSLACDFTSPDAIITFSEINSPVTNNSVVGDGITNLNQLVAYYQVTVNGKTYRSPNGRYVYSYETNAQNGLTRNLTISVRAVSIYGDLGEETVITARNQPMGQPASVKVESQLVNLTVSWLNPNGTVPDYQTTDIWITPTKVAPTADNLVADANTGWWTEVRSTSLKSGWVWVAHRDVFGYDGIPSYSAPIYYAETTIDDLMTDSEFEGNFKELQDNVNKIDAELVELGKEVDANKVEVDSALSNQQNLINANKAEVDSALVNQQNQINAEKDRLNGTIADLAETEAGLNQAKLDILKNATDIKTNKTELTSQGARLTTVEQVASDNTGSIATVSQRVEAVNKDLGAKIETNRQSIVTTNAAMASMDTRLSSEIGKNTASITETNKTVATLDSTVASMDTRLSAKIDKNTADISTVQQSVADANGSMASMETRLQAQINTNKSGIATNKTAIAATDKNLAEYKLTVSTEFDETNGRIDTVSSSVSSLEGTVATQGQTITANYNDLDGKIQTNATAIVNTNKVVTALDTKLSAEIDAVDGKANSIKATVDQQQIAIAATDKALTELKTSTNAQFGTVNARIDTVQTNLATTDSALASLDTKLQTQIDSNKAGIATNSTAITNANKSIASLDTKLSAEIDAVDSKVDGVKTTVDQQQIAIAATDESLAEFKTSTNAQFGTVNSRIDTVQTNLATTDKALADYKIEANAKIDKNSADIKVNATAITTTNSALSSYKTSNDAQVNELKASVTTISQAQASTDGEVNAMYGLRVDANGKVAGMTLGATPNGSTVDFLADTFRIANATTGTPVTAFEVRDGNVMMRNALIGDLTASNIRAGAITGNEINAGSVIRAGSGNTSATLDGANGSWRIYAGNTNPAAAPFRVSTTGQLIATNANITGAITATSGSFSGSITANGGAINGRLSMNGGFIDGRAGQDSINLGGGSFRVDSVGNLYANGGNFKGTILAEKIIGDIVNAGLHTFAATSTNIVSGQLFDIFRMNVPAVSWDRYMLISEIPFNWRAQEQGGRYNMFVRDSTGRNSNIWSGSKPLGPIDGFPSMEAVSIRIPAGSTWVAISVQGDRRQTISRYAVAHESNWQVFNAGSGGINIVAS